MSNTAQNGQTEAKKAQRKPRDPDAIPATISVKVDETLEKVLRNAKQSIEEATPGITVNYQQVVRYLMTKAAAS